MLNSISLLWARIRYPLRAFFAWLALVVGLIGGIVTLTLSVTESATAKEWILSLSLAAITIVALSALAVLGTQISGHQNFTSTLSLQNQASETLRDLRIFLRESVDDVGAGNAIPRGTLSRAQQIIEEILTVYSNIYSIWTATRCRTCVKLIDVGQRNGGTPVSPETVILFTLARDKYSAKEQKKHDKKRADERLDKLNDNSDFLRLWDEEVDDDGFFLSEDLRKEPEYDTSSINYWRNVVGNPNRNTGDKWPLWYISTIVWPIRQEPREDIGITEQTCLGFLAVDSRVPRVFNSDAHPYLGKILANALYPILDLYTQLVSAESTPDLSE